MSTSKENSKIEVIEDVEWKKRKMSNRVALVECKMYG